ncbi:MAG: hypothetical protein ACK56I_23995, partial [bacterium]
LVEAEVQRPRAPAQLPVQLSGLDRHRRGAQPPAVGVGLRQQAHPRLPQPLAGGEPDERADHAALRAHGSAPATASARRAWPAGVRWIGSSGKKESAGRAGRSTGSSVASSSRALRWASG